MERADRSFTSVLVMLDPSLGTVRKFACILLASQWQSFDSISYNDS